MSELMELSRSRSSNHSMHRHGCRQIQLDGSKKNQNKKANNDIISIKQLTGKDRSAYHYNTIQYNTFTMIYNPSTIPLHDILICGIRWISPISAVISYDPLVIYYLSHNLWDPLDITYILNYSIQSDNHTLMYVWALYSYFFFFRPH